MNYDTTQPDRTNPNNSMQVGVIDLKELINLLWSGKFLIIQITSVFILGSIFYSVNLNNYYRSEAILTVYEPAPQASGLTRISGLASIAGVNISQSVNKGALVTNTIWSRVFFKHLLSVDENVLPSIMAAESYDSEEKKLVFDSNIYDAVNKEWPRGKPTYIQAYQAYRGIIIADYDTVGSWIHLSAEHISPIFAKEFLELIIRESDNIIRQKDLKRSSEALAYLTSEISRTSVLDIRSNINQLILDQLQTQMTANISSNYVLNIVEPPFIPEKKSKPSRSLTILLGAMLGFVIGIVWILMRHYFALYSTKATSGS